LPASKYLPQKEIATSRTAPVLDVDTAARLRAALGRINRRLRATPAGTAAGLSATEISILFSVDHRGPIGLSELAAHEGVNPTMLSRIVRNLGEAGLLERMTNPDDARAAFVVVTQQGRRLAEQIRHERTDALNAAISPLSAADRKRLQEALPALEALAEELRR
jgi:DNA-binding MarR family transcriptional regulator